VAAAGGTACDKAVTYGNGGPIKSSKHCQFPVRPLFSGHSVLTQKSRDYVCVLIVHSRAVDPQCSAGMTEREERAQQHFKELKDTLPELSPRWWKREFKSYVDKFIAECLNEKDIITAIPGEDKEEEELDHTHLYGI